MAVELAAACLRMADETFAVAEEREDLEPSIAATAKISAAATPRYKTLRVKI
jgi:hypothetical protein